MKYLKVMDGTNSNANGYKYKIDEVNVANNWNPNSLDPKEMGGFNFSVEDKILRWLHRGDTIYDVILPSDAEVINCPNENCPNGVFRTNKIIITNPCKITDEMVIDLYNKSTLPDKTYYQCLVVMLYRKHYEALKYIIKDRINYSNIDECIKEFEIMISDREDKVFEYDKLWLEAKETYDSLKEIQNKLDINIYIDKDIYRKVITDDKIINITGESGSGKSTYIKNNYNSDNYIIIDTDLVFSKDSTGINKEFGEYLNKKYPTLDTNKDFNIIYKEILEYFKASDKTIVIDSAQYRNLLKDDIKLLKGEIIIIRTCIDTCIRRRINRWKNKNINYKDDELNEYISRTMNLYKWYKYLNKFIYEVDKL